MSEPSAFIVTIRQQNGCGPRFDWNAMRPFSTTCADAPGTTPPRTTGNASAGRKTSAKRIRGANDNMAEPPRPRGGKLRPQTLSTVPRSGQETDRARSSSARPRERRAQDGTVALRDLRKRRQLDARRLRVYGPELVAGSNIAVGDGTGRDAIDLRRRERWIKQVVLLVEGSEEVNDVVHALQRAPPSRGRRSRPPRAQRARRALPARRVRRRRARAAPPERRREGCSRAPAPGRAG